MMAAALRERLPGRLCQAGGGEEGNSSRECGQKATSLRAYLGRLTNDPLLCPMGSMQPLLRRIEAEIYAVVCVCVLERQSCSR